MTGRPAGGAQAAGTATRDGAATTGHTAAAITRALSSAVGPLCLKNGFAAAARVEGRTTVNLPNCSWFLSFVTKRPNSTATLTFLLILGTVTAMVGRWMVLPFPMG